MAIQLSTASRNLMADALIGEIGNAALIRIYDGAVPANVAAGIGGSQVLAELDCATPFAPAASGGAITAGTITNDASANNTGTATYFRIFKNGGVTAVVQGTAGTVGTDMILNTASITSGGIVAVTSCVLTMPGA